ncbi:MAG: DUF3862 domain-containing protein [Candidatus Sericytochromatia bacterium]|nr:DUF3862 domain-containing protein [Candidatus Sericytochromatia bacterium]
MITCSQCQTPLSPGTRFCPNCGLQFENPVPESAAAFQASSATPTKKQTNNKKTNPLVLGLLGLVGFFVLVGIVGGNQGGNSSTSSNDAAPAAQAPVQEKPPKPPKPKSQVTMANYNRLKTGMSYEQVVAILGKAGTELSSNDIAGYQTVMYQWEGDSFASNMNAMFQNGKLMQKAQFGLK